MLIKNNGKTRWIVMISDFQCGHTLGLLMPGTVLQREEGGKKYNWTPSLTPMQEYLYELYTKYIKDVKQIIGKDEFIMLYPGDLCQGVYLLKYLVSSRMSDQFQIAYECLRPWLEMKNLKAIRFARGTWAHTEREGSLESMIADYIAARHPNIDIGIAWQGIVDYSGLSVEYVHKGAHPGIRFWTSGKVAQLYLQDVVERDLQWNRKPPDLVLSGHYHRYTHVCDIRFWGGKEYKTDLIILPSWQGKDEYTIDVTRGLNDLHNGLVLGEIWTNKQRHTVNYYPMVEVLDLRVKETIA